MGTEYSGHRDKIDSICKYYVKQNLKKQLFVMASIVAKKCDLIFWLPFHLR